MYIYASLFVILLSVVFYRSWGNEPKALSKEMESSLNEQMNSIKRVVQTDIITNSRSYLTFPVEDSKDEFTTFYTYKAMEYFDIHPNEQICTQYANKMGKSDFIKNQEEFFTGIERMYHASMLMDGCKKTRSDIQSKKSIQDLYDRSYFDEGYFLSDEFKDYRNKEGYEDVKLTQTQMMLKLGKKWDIHTDKRNDRIKAWLDQFIEKETDPLYIRKYMDSVELLGFNPNKEILQQLVYTSIIQKDHYEFLDLLSIESLAYMHQKGWITLSRDEIKLIMQRLSFVNNQFSDIQQEYYTLSIYDHFNQLDVYPHKEAMTSQFNRLVYPDGMLPLISKTSNPYSPYYSMLIALDDGEESVASIQLKKRVSSLLKDASLKELMKMDPFEVLSYIHLQKEINSSFGDTEFGKRLGEKIKESLSNQLNAGNIIKNSYYIYSLSLLDAPIKKNELPKNVDAALKKLAKGQTKLFTNSTDFSNLLLINSLLESGIYKDELEEVIPYVKKIQIDLSSQVSAYELYYKTVFLEKMGEEPDVEEVGEKLMELHSGSGYKLNNKQKYENFYATIFLNQLNQRILGE
ncbi:hypothetical protein NQ095_07690 [Rossellomorea sp. SC111]|nr:hypothetical protein [Rossellomorea sp. SC111]